MNRRRLLMPFLLVAALVFLLQPAPRAASTQAPAASAATPSAQAAPEPNPGRPPTTCSPMSCPAVA